MLIIKEIMNYLVDILIQNAKIPRLIVSISKLFFILFIIDNVYFENICTYLVTKCQISQTEVILIL